MKRVSIILVVFVGFLMNQECYGQEKLLKEDFTSFISYKWKILKAELNDKEIPASIFGDFSMTYNSDGTYSFVRQGKTIEGKWEFLQESQILITSDIDGVERHKVLLAKDQKMVMESVVPEGTLKIEYFRDM